MRMRRLMIAKLYSARIAQVLKMARKKDGPQNLTLRAVLC
jgi:hypothetical protein